MNIVDYIPAVLWVALLSWMLYRHSLLFVRYNRQLAFVNLLRRQGRGEEGMSLVAENQRVRYMVRIGLAVFGLGLGLVAVVRMVLGQTEDSAALGLAVLAYLYASEGLTGWLTVRDGHVLDCLEELDNKKGA